MNEAAETVDGILDTASPPGESSEAVPLRFDPVPWHQSRS
jgi:hypothetical protein